MSKLEKTKENIGVTRLDEKTKKELFNKFVESGGQVVADKRESAFKDFDRDKQKQYREKIDTHRQKIQKTKPVAVTAKERAAAAAAQQQKVKVLADAPRRAGVFSGWLNRTIIRFRLFFLGVTDFWGGYYKPGFIEKFNTEYKSALLEIQMIYLDVFKQNPKIGKQVIDELDSLKPLYFELIEMIASMYDRGAFMRITQAFEEFPDIAQRISDYREFFLGLFKKLYIQSGYTVTLFDAFERAIAGQMKIEKNKASIYASKRKKIRNDLYVVFNKLFPRLYWLFCSYQGAAIPLNDPAIASILGITLEDRPGRRQKGAQVTEVEVPLPGDAAEKADAEKKQEVLPDEIKRGLEMINALDMKKLRAEYDRQNIFKYVKDSDKILMTNLLLREFDGEYSLILTTNKIKYNVTYGPAGKMDYRIQLSDLYNDLRDCIEALRQYAELLEAYEKARLDKPTSNAQYIEYSKKLTALEKTRRNTGSQARMTVAAFMDRVATQMKLLIEDMNGTQAIVSNPQEVLSFDSDIEGVKKLSGKKVYESIYLTYCFASALSFRLSGGGDLAGDIEQAAGEQPAAVAAPMASEEPFVDTPIKDAPGEAPPAKKTEPEKKEEPKSVIQELEDLF
ncbi:MAG: hypothetical protein KBA61_14850 [Spirochaetes bacterium]|nr:hypothetical protein [Spirochaetota bacterium]HPA70853.1 hypothetical protein [Spirochaetota bacterium]